MKLSGGVRAVIANYPNADGSVFAEVHVTRWHRLRIAVAARVIAVGLGVMGFAVNRLMPAWVRAGVVREIRDGICRAATDRLG